MGCSSFGVPQDLVLLLKETQQYKNFVETGTFYGGSAAWASEHFDHVFTIEIQPNLWSQAKEKYRDKKNIEFIFGSSQNEIKKLENLLTSPTLFWLDGHYSGSDTGGIDYECPVMDELVIALEFKDSAILVDDARLFLGPPPPPHKQSHWPRVDEIFAFIHYHDSERYTTLIDDVLISVPNNLKYIVDEYWKSTFKQRFFPETTKPKFISRLISKILN